MSAAVDTVFLFDVDNTLLDNDRIQADLRERLASRPWRSHLRAILGNLSGAMGRSGLHGLFRSPRAPETRRSLRSASFPSPPTGSWTIRSRIASTPGPLMRWSMCGSGDRAVILSDGDAVLQPRKIARSGLWKAFDGDVLIYVHKEKELEGRRAPLSSRSLRAHRRQDPHPRRGEGSLGRSSDHRLSQAGPLRDSRSRRETACRSTRRSTRSAICWTMIGRS